MKVTTIPGEPNALEARHSRGLGRLRTVSEGWPDDTSREQVCPRCARAEAPGSYCSGCGYSGPDLWRPVSEAKRAMAARKGALGHAARTARAAKSGQQSHAAPRPGANPALPPVAAPSRRTRVPHGGQTR